MGRNLRLRQVKLSLLESISQVSHSAPRSARLTQLTGRGRVRGCGCGFKPKCEVVSGVDSVVSVCQLRANFRSNLRRIANRTTTATGRGADTGTATGTCIGTSTPVAKLTATCLAAKPTWEQLTKGQPLSLATLCCRPPPCGAGSWFGAAPWRCS